MSVWVWALVLLHKGEAQVVGIYSSKGLAEAAAAPFDWVETDIWDIEVDAAPDPDIGR